MAAIARLGGVTVDRLAARLRSLHPVADPARPGRRTRGGRRRGAGTGRRRGLGRTDPGAPGRRTACGRAARCSRHATASRCRGAARTASPGPRRRTASCTSRTSGSIRPTSGSARRSTLVRANARWENDNQPYFEGETEPCINGMVVAQGAYFGVDVDAVVERLVGEQLEDGGWNCEAENGSVRGSFHTTIRVLEGLLLHEQAAGGSAAATAARRRGEAYLLERNLLRRKSTGELIDPAFLAVRVPDPLALRRPARPRVFPLDRGVARIRGRRGDRTRSLEAQPTGPGCWTTPRRARSRSRWRTATAGPAAGTRCARSGCCAGPTRHPRRKPEGSRTPALWRGDGLACLQGLARCP